MSHQNKTNVSHKKIESSMKTMNLKKAASVMVLASVATVMSAQTPVGWQARDGARGMCQDRYGLREIGA